MILSCETCFGFASLSLFDEKEHLNTLKTETLNMQSELLPSLCYELFKNSGVQLQDIKKLIVTTGPGSFTGIRVGMSFLYGIASGIKSTILGISCFESYLAGIMNKELGKSELKDIFYIAIPSGKDWFFIKKYEKKYLSQENDNIQMIHAKDLEKLEGQKFIKIYGDENICSKSTALAYLMNLSHTLNPNALYMRSAVF